MDLLTDTTALVWFWRAQDAMREGRPYAAATALRLANAAEADARGTTIPTPTRLACPITVPRAQLERAEPITPDWIRRA